ncbi:alpha-1,3-mannosyl-glycoprotein 2-beta-N-acetylglucosaminyltransferase-like [Anneissia japonica]|uniref:alpha-1,3-mannosyl-glycoprotein 2-beta-N-acetylglucosaminyltransferase-like n=1 Tax=Anneissia japonica TaxID=1529436 RepID=UPI0014255123|nr:alpha-1,3-mannosyl-glycoprotein 2-beta-N-acetylglucosaminyltransferase-like [Anneissia japonica]
MKKHRTFLTVCILLFLCWNMGAYYFFVYGAKRKDKQPASQLSERLARLQAELKDQMQVNEQLLIDIDKEKEILLQKKKVQEISQYKRKLEELNKKEHLEQPVLVNNHLPQQRIKNDYSFSSVVLPVLLIACNRPTAVKRSLDTLLRHRPSEKQFPIVVSQDCGHAETEKVIRSYGDKVRLIKQPDLSEIKVPVQHKKFIGYYKIARHYRWALNQIFKELNYNAAIIVEDDLDIAVDFFEYFLATYPLLVEDKSLWCVSAWNDNGKLERISNEADLLYRSDFFPGLGWMLLKEAWINLEPNWPEGFWDDWMRHPNQRKERACIRPEISRTDTFGKIGVSKGQFFEQHLKFIKLNTQFIPFTQVDLSYLKKENYDPRFRKEVYDAPEVSLHQLTREEARGFPVVRIQYRSKDSFKTIAKSLGIMNDFKSGVPRTGYLGVVSFIYKGHRVYLAPDSSWSGYDVSWM